MYTIGDLLKSQQTKLGYSDAALSRMAGISVNTLKSVFKSEPQVRLSSYASVAKALDKKLKLTLEG
jgi:lambda repressor-like predicted transcriptional regulator